MSYNNASNIANNQTSLSQLISQGLLGSAQANAGGVLGSADALANAGINGATAQANALTGAANANASGIVGSANARSQGLGGLLSLGTSLGAMAMGGPAGAGLLSGLFSNSASANQTPTGIAGALTSKPKASKSYLMAQDFSSPVTRTNNYAG